jgi:hypothetical protein
VTTGSYTSLWINLFWLRRIAKSGEKGPGFGNPGPARKSVDKFILASQDCQIQRERPGIWQSWASPREFFRAFVTFVAAF